MRVQIMEEAKEEVCGLGRKYVNKDDGKSNFREKRARGFGTRSDVRTCVVDKCKQDHPPWVCPMFKELPMAA